VEGTAADDPQGGVETAHGAAGMRVLVSFAVGIAAFGVAWLTTPWQAASLIGWSVATTVFIAWIWFTVAGMDGAATARHAAVEDLSRRTADLVLILASVTSLIGVGLSLLEASDTEGLEKAMIVAVASVSVILSWATVHTVFTLREAVLRRRRGDRLQRGPGTHLHRLRLPRIHDRDDLPGLRHVDRVEGDQANGPAPCLHVVPVRDRRRRHDDQRRVRAVQPVAARNGRAATRYIGLTSWK
jgi:hypothetical protein